MAEFFKSTSACGGVRGQGHGDPVNLSRVTTLVGWCLIGVVLPLDKGWTDDADPISKAAIAALRSQVETWVDEGTIVGAEILVLQHGADVWHEAFGLRDQQTGERLERDGVFRIRSMTKPIIGTAALRLIDAGRLGLDDTVGEYLPELSSANSSVTIRQLLSHTAGYEFSPFPRRRQNYASLRESVLEAAAAGPTLPPGEFRYSDLGSATLGAVLEAASGKDLESLIRTEVFRVFGMRDSYTYFAPDFEWSSRMNSTHWWNDDTDSHERYWSPEEQQGMPYFRASGGVYSTVRDYAIFMEAWRTGVTRAGERFLSNELMEAALTELQDAPYGLHWEVEGAGDPADFLFGHGGSDGTLAISIPGRGLTLLYFTQSRGQDCRNQFVMLAGLTGEFGALEQRISWGRWREIGGLIDAKVDDAVDLSRFEGIFLADDKIVVVGEVDGRLRLIRGTDTDPQHGLPRGDELRSVRTVCQHFLAPPFPAVDLIPIGDGKFRMAAVVNGGVAEVYWPHVAVQFRLQDDRVQGYEIEYDADTRETGRAFVTELAAPPLRMESIASDFQDAVAGEYESANWGGVVRFADEVLILDVDDEIHEFHHQGAGMFANADGDVLIIYRDMLTEAVTMSLLEASGRTHRLTRASN